MSGRTEVFAAATIAVATLLYAASTLANTKTKHAVLKDTAVPYETVKSPVEIIYTWKLLECEVAGNSGTNCHHDLDLKGAADKALCNFISTEDALSGNASYRFEPAGAFTNPVDGMTSYHSGRIHFEANPNYSTGVGGHVKLSMVGISVVPGGMTQATRQKYQCKN